MSAVGNQFSWDVINPACRKNGMRAYPFGIINSGCAVTTPTIAAGVVSIAVAAGVVTLDAYPNLAAAGATLATAVLPVAVGYVIPVFVNPVRATLTALRSDLVAGFGNDGDQAFEVVRYGAIDIEPAYEQLQAIWVKRAGVWIQRTEVTDKDPIFDPPSTDHFSLPNNVIKGAVTSLVEEVNVWYSRAGYSVFLSSPAPSFARIGASVKVGSCVFDVTSPTTIANYRFRPAANSYA